MYGAILTLVIILHNKQRKVLKQSYEILKDYKYPLWWVAYIGALVVEVLPRTLLKWDEVKVKSKLNRLYRREEITYKILQSYRIGLGLWVIIVGLGFSVVYFYVNRQGNVLQDYSILRLPDESQEVFLTVEVEKDDQQLQQDFNVTVPREDLSPQVIQERLKACKEQLLMSLNSLIEVNGDLNLPTQIKGITIEWHSSNRGFNNDGTLNPEYISLEGNDVVLEGVLSIDEYSEVLHHEFKVFPPPYTVEHALKDIEEDIRGGRYLEESQLVLPKEKRDIQVSWTQTTDSTWLWICVFSIALGFISYVIVHDELGKKVDAYDRRLQMRFPDMVIKFTLLMNAGLSISNTWDKICQDYQQITGQVKEPLYEEMLYTLQRIKGGISEYQAFEELSCRVNNHHMRKFLRILMGSIKKGNEEVVVQLEDLAHESWQQRVDIAKQLGEEASSKLLFPMVMLLVVIIAVVMAPAFMSLH